MGSILQFVKRSKIFKKLFKNNLFSPKLFSVEHPLNFLLLQKKNGTFNRYDAIVRLLAIENEFNLNDNGWDLYLKMQTIRANSIKTSIDFKNDFKNLIYSVKEKGFDKKFPIDTTSTGLLSDGSHRLACALYFDLPEIHLKKNKNDFSDVFYGLEWFEKNGFTEKETEQLFQRYESLRTANTTEFMALLWSPIVKHKEEVIKDVEQHYHIKEIKTIDFENDFEYAAFVKGMYAIDDIDDWKIEKKLKYMEPYPKKVTVILFEMDFPDYRKKTLNGKPLSKNVEKLKKIIREKYSKRIENYFYDIILHIGDNSAHTAHMNKILEKDLNIVEYLEKLKNLNYVILKEDTPYQPTNFPETYSLGKDLDILCTLEDYPTILQITKDFRKDYEEKYEIKCIEKTKGEKIRFELNDFLCFQIDLSWEIFKIEQLNVPSFLSDRIIKGNFFMLTLEKELLIRAFEFIGNSKKKHHLDFLKKHNAQINWEFMASFMSAQQINLLKKEL